jgi:uncharacterized phage-associated protein
VTTLKFDERRATQAAAYLLQKAGGEMYHIQLVKLMYLADRTALIDFGTPITFDRYFSMKNGPVLSATLDLIHEDRAPSRDSYWTHHISETCNHKVKALADPGIGLLSRAEVSILDSAYEQWGTKNRWTVVDESHELPEWEDPGSDGRRPISARDVLIAGGYRSDEANDLLEELDAVQAASAQWGEVELAEGF